MVGGNRTEDAYELDLAPMLSMMVTLIPILLLATAFVQVKIIETPLPQVVQQAIEKDRKNDERKTEISVAADLVNGFVVTITDAKGAKRVVRVPNIEGKFNYDGLHENLYKLKQEASEVFRLSLLPGSDVPYSAIVKTIDAARRARSGEAKFQIVDKEKQESAETDLMFPDVVFGDVIEG